MTLRRVHYRLVIRDDTTYRNTLGDYKQLSKWLVRLRLEGVVEWEWVVDRLREPRGRPMWRNLPAFVEAARRSYYRDVWQGQPEYLEVWLEKDALAPLFEEALEPYGVTLNVGRGFDGWTSIKEAAERFGSGEAVTVLYFGDFDPSGEDMARSLQERWASPGLPGGGSFPDVVKCALTFGDIARYELPPKLTKKTDTRSPAFVARYGDVAVELDALPTSVLQERIRDEVEHRMDLEALERTREEERADRQRLDELLG
jgi:hypothetical protein